MKKLRSLFAVLLALTMLLAGCGGESDEDFLEEDYEAEEQVEEQAEDVPEAKDLSLGVLADGVYTNEYLDVQFGPEGWTLLGADQLQDALANANELLQGTELEEQLEGLTQVMDMQGTAPDGVSNVNVVYTKMGAAERLANLAIDEDAAMDAVLAQQDTLISSYESAGISVTSMDKVDVTYRGETRTGIRTLGSVQGIDLCIIQVYERTLGSYSVVVTSTSTDEATALETLSLFEALNP